MNLHDEDRTNAVDMIKVAHEHGKNLFSKGDVPGHEFHGNQYSSVGGSSEKTPSAKVAEAASQHAFGRYDNSTKPEDYGKAIKAHEAASAAHVAAMDEPGNDRSYHSQQADEHAHEANKFREWQSKAQGGTYGTTRNAKM